MALQRLGVALPYPLRLGAGSVALTTTAGSGKILNDAVAASTQLNAANEKITFTGAIEWQPDVTTALEIYRIHFMVGTVTTNLDASNNLRVGVQDPGTNRRGDGAWDTYGDRTNSLNANTVNFVQMSSGTPTYATGAQVAICFELTTWTAADINIGNVPAGSALQDPSVIGATGASQSSVPVVVVESTTGKFGIIRGGAWCVGNAEIQFNNGTAQTEYGCVIQVPFRCKATGMWVLGNTTNAAQQLSAILYSGTLSSPTAERTVAGGREYFGVVSTNGRFTHIPFTSEFTLEANTQYILTIKPSDANNYELPEYTIGADASFAPGLPGGSTYYQAYRSGSGTFSTDTTRFHPIGLLLSSFEDGAGGAAGMIVHPGMAGGMRA